MESHSHRKAPVYFDGVKVRTVDATTVEKISNILSNIIQLKVIRGKNLEEPIITGLSSVLNDQPAEHHEYILSFALKFYDICRELYHPDLIKNERNARVQLDVWDFDASSQSNKGNNNERKSAHISQSVKSIFKNSSNSGGVEKGDTVSQLKPTINLSSTSSLDSTTISSIFNSETGDDDSDVYEDGLIYLREQTIDEFIDDARDQLLRIGAADLPTQRPENIAALLDDLGNSDTNVPNGPEWLSLVEKGYSDRQRGTIYYALAAVGFENWHRHQVEKLVQLNPDKKLAMAKLEISSIVLGLKPVTDTKKEEWNRRRKQLNTHLTRGRKWRRVIDTFGRGILLKNPWRLAKTKALYLERLIKELKKDERKCLILKLLGIQVDLLFEEGSVSEPTFCKQLRDSGFRLSDCESLQECLDLELKELRNTIQRSMTGRRLVVKGIDHDFEAKSLDKLGPAQWLNNDLILACMHLSRKLPFVRVCWSIPTHNNNNGRLLLLPDPLKAAANAIKKWKRKAEEEQHIYLFPLFQRDNHFSLLEINTDEGYVYHYDSFIDALSGGENIDIKKACTKAFPELKYVEKSGIQQDDDSSCGPIVIKVASRRMWGETATSGIKSDYNPESLRLDAVRILRDAWETGALEEAPTTMANKRPLSTQEGGMGDRKRQKLAHIARECV